MRFGKGRERSFRGFMTVETRYLPRQAPGESGLARSSAKAQPCGQRGEKRMTDTFDFVVVGGGSGGCAVASRLSEDPGTSVALLEAGGECNNWVVTSPGAMILMISGKVNNWAFDTVPQAVPQRPSGDQPPSHGG